MLARRKKTYIMKETMKRLTTRICIAAVLCVGLSFNSLSTFAQDLNDLSDDINNPNLITLGVNGVTGVTLTNSVFESDLSTGVTGNKIGDIDFWNIVVAPGFQLDSIVLDSYDGAGLAFFGFAEDQLGGNPALAAEQAAFTQTALGFTLIDGSESSLFDDLAAGAQGVLPGIGFDPSQPLGAGTYAFVFQNTGPDVNTYYLSFNASIVPEPTSAAALATMGMFLIGRRRRSA